MQVNYPDYIIFDSLSHRPVYIHYNSIRREDGYHVFKDYFFTVNHIYGGGIDLTTVVQKYKILKDTISYTSSLDLGKFTRDIWGQSFRNDTLELFIQKFKIRYLFEPINTLKMYIKDSVLKVDLSEFKIIDTIKRKQP